jgi:hypothetical protein
MSIGGSASKLMIKQVHSSRGCRLRGYAQWSIHKHKAAHYSSSDSWSLVFVMRERDGSRACFAIGTEKLRCEKFSIFPFNLCHEHTYIYSSVSNPVAFLVSSSRTAVWQRAFFFF